MTLAPDMQMAPGAWLDDVPSALLNGTAGCSAAVAVDAMDRGYERPSCSGARYAELLEDAVFAEWAGGTAARYHVSPLEALGALADALARDGMSRATTSIETAGLLVHV